MKISQQLVKQAGIVPRLRLAVKKAGGGTVGTGPHIVKLLEDKIVRGKDYETGQIIEKVRYLVVENGEQKIYETRLKSKDAGELSYLVQHMAEIPEGQEITMEYKRKGVRGYIEVSWEGKMEAVESEENEDGADENDQSNALL